jgi:tetratricopeptide (TPR) repeat protein
MKRDLVIVLMPERRESNSRIRKMYSEAITAERLGKFALALQMFLETIEQGTDDEGELYFHCGWCLEQDDRGNKLKALFYYQKAAIYAHSPACKINGFFRAGWLLMQSKEFAKAATMFRSAVDYGELVDVRTEAYHHAAFWYASCLESLALYLDAIRWYRFVEALDPRLDPESRYREIICLNQVGSFEEAYRVCLSFESPSSADFDRQRYDDLCALVKKEKEILYACLSESSSPQFLTGGL